MIDPTADEVIEAVKVLDALASRATSRMYGSEYDDMLRKQTEAYNLLMKHIRSLDRTSDVKIVYEYKLRRKDGKYLNKSSWDEKGKTYKNKGAMNSAIGYIIESQINRIPFPTLADANGDVTRYRAMYRESQIARQSKVFRATFIPEDWIVIAIAVNTAQEPKEIPANEFYKGSA